ncbi:hypothetical protein ACFPRL_10530 [Pseudoclavibacter helvolus]
MLSFGDDDPWTATRQWAEMAPKYTRIDRTAMGARTFSACTHDRTSLRLAVQFAAMQFSE